LFKPLYLDKETSQTSNMPGFRESDYNVWTNIFNLIAENGALFTFFFLGIGITILYRRNIKKQ
jgi:hypothetical protein